MKSKRIALMMILFVLPLVLTVHAQEEQTPARQILTAKQHNVTISTLEGSVNSSDDDFAPVVLGNGKVLYFTSNREGDQDVFSAVWNGSSWAEVQTVGSVLNTGDDEGSTAITPDGHWIVFTGCERDDGYGDCDLYMAEYLSGTWRNILNLGAGINTEHWESQPSISPDGLLLFFASDRPGGEGGSDIWMSQRAYGGNWKQPVNLGGRVNTSGDEFAPYIAADNSTLYYSSDMLPGVGGQDIYRTGRVDQGWTMPVHLGTPVNSEYDDYFCSLKLNSDEMLFTSNRGSAGGDLDILLAVPNPFPPGAVTTVIGTVTDSRTGAPVGATLTVRDIQSNEILSSFHSDEIDGGYIVVLQSGRGYVITAEAPEYLFYSDRFDVAAKSANQMIRKDIALTRDIVRLLVFFDFDKATLQRESYVDLQRAVEWLKSNPTVKVELAGYTDNVGAADYNRKLSKERAEAVLDYLVSKGVPSSSVQARGYGMDDPISTNETDVGRSLNRRVEFKVMSR